MGQIIQGNINLWQRPHVTNPDGSVSTVRSMSFEDNGREVLVPTVSMNGTIMSNREAIDEYRRSGQHLGIFDSPAAANVFAEQLHNDMARGKYDIRPAASHAADIELPMEGPRADPRLRQNILNKLTR